MCRFYKIPQLPACEGYEVYSDTPIAVLYRHKRTDKTDPCPFCGERHTHGYPDGHRSYHCRHLYTHRQVKGFRTKIERIPSQITAVDGTILERKHGYIVRTRDEYATEPAVPATPELFLRTLPI